MLQKYNKVLYDQNVLMLLYKIGRILGKIFIHFLQLDIILSMFESILEALLYNNYISTLHFEI